MAPLLVSLMIHSLLVLGMPLGSPRVIGTGKEMNTIRIKVHHHVREIQRSSQSPSREASSQKSTNKKIRRERREVLPGVIREGRGDLRRGEEETGARGEERDHPRGVAVKVDPLPASETWKEKGGGEVSPPAILSMPEPVYPLLSRKRGEEGTVIYSVIVNREGEGRELTLLRSSGFKMLDRAAERALKKAVFLPARGGGITLEVKKEIAVRFQLR